MECRLPIELIATKGSAANREFVVELGEPKWDLNSFVSQLDEDEAEIARLGAPEVGIRRRLIVTINEEAEIKKFVDKMVKRSVAAASAASTSTWKQQFVEAFSFFGGEGKTVDEEEAAFYPGTQVFLCSLIHEFIHSFIRSFICLYIYSSNDMFIH